MLVKMRESKGFTLVELMIVVAIIGILAAVAVPYYQKYVAKSRLTSLVMPTVHSLETNISAYYAVQSTMPSEMLTKDTTALKTFLKDADTRFVSFTPQSDDTILVTIDAEQTVKGGTAKPFKSFAEGNTFRIVADKSSNETAINWKYTGELANQLGLSSGGEDKPATPPPTETAG